MRHLASEDYEYTYERQRANQEDAMNSEDIPPVVLTSKIPMNTIQFFPHIPAIPTHNGDAEEFSYMATPRTGNRAGVQTSNPYDLNPRLIYNEIERQVRELITGMMTPVMERHYSLNEDLRSIEQRQVEQMN